MKWPLYISLNNIKRRLKRNIVSIVSLVIGLVSSMLIIGFSFGSNPSIVSKSYSQFDYGTMTLYKEKKQNIEGSKMSLVQMSRPSLEEVNNIDIDLNKFEVEINTDSLVPLCPLIYLGDEVLDGYQYTQIYSFTDNSVNHDLLLDGYLPAVNSLYEAVINKTAYKELKSKIKGCPLGVELSIHSDFESHYYSQDERTPVVSDIFIFDKLVKIVGVVDDFDFLSVPKIYYSYSALRVLLQETYLINLSSYLNEPITWYDRILNSHNEENISSYSYRLFLHDYHDYSSLKDIVGSLKDPYKIDSMPLTMCQTMIDLFSAATMGMELFLVIALMGTALIMGIFSYSSYSEDRKTSAILTCLGANKNQIFLIYLIENMFSAFIALVSSFLLAPILSLIINSIIKSVIGLSNVIAIPFMKLFGIYFLFPLLLIVSSLLITIGATYIPLIFSKKISPKEELSDE